MPLPPGFPSFDNQQINTVAVVADRSLIMIGGLIETNQNQEEYVPFLGSIPVIGAAFGTTFHFGYGQKRAGA